MNIRQLKSLTRTIGTIFIVLSAHSLTLANDSTVVHIQGCDQFISVSDLLYEDLVRAYGAENVEKTQYGEVRFSPNGRFLAIQENNGLWMLDIDSRKARRVAGREFKTQTGSYVHFFKWVAEDTVLIVTGDGSGKKLIRATMTVSIVSASETDRTISKSWPDEAISPSLRFTVTVNKEGVNYSDRKTNRGTWLGYGYSVIDYRPQWTRDEKFFVYARGEGSGDNALFAAASTTPAHRFKIEGHLSFGAFMSVFSVSPTGDRVAFPRVYSHPGEVAIYNLLSRRVETVITVGIYPVSVDWSKRDMLAILCNNCIGRKEMSKKLEHYFSYPIYLFSLSRSTK